MLWVYTCEFHRKFPLDHSIYCTCTLTEVDRRPDFTFHGAVGYFDKEEIKENDSK